MRGGDCVFNEDSWNQAVAHCVKYVTADRVLSECGKWMRYAALTHNHSRREPCESCAAAIERRNRAEAAQNRSYDTVALKQYPSPISHPDTVRTAVSDGA